MVTKLLHDLIPKMPPNNGCSWLMGIGYCLLLFVSVIATFVSDANFAQVASLAATTILILTLFRWLGAFGQVAPPPTVTKFAVWVSSTLIMAVLTWSITMEGPFLAKVIFWVLFAVTSIGTHFILFWRQPSERIIPPPNLCFCFCLIFVFFNSFALIYKLEYGTNILTDRINSAIFEFASWLASILLFWCIAAMEIAPHNSAMKEWMKFGTWAFATMLGAMVVSKAAEIIFTGPMKYVAWAMVGASSFSSLYAFFFQREAYLVANNFNEAARVSSV